MLNELIITTETRMDRILQHQELLVLGGCHKVYYVIHEALQKQTI